MKKVPDLLKNPDDYSKLSSAELLAVIADFQQQLESREKVLQVKDDAIHQRDRYITLLEEQLRLKKAQQFAASSEKQAYQIHLFDEAELEEELEALREQLPDDADSPKPSKKKRRQRGFSDKLVRERIELTLSEDEKAGASKVFFTKVKEELQFIPAQLKVFEIWQEKAVFHEDGQEQIVAAKRPVHPLGKCIATTSLLAYIITSKYADGLPLYRLEKMLARLGHEVSRTSMAHWIIRLDDVFKPLINLMRDVQNSSRYLQADETRIQVLKEDCKSVRSDKWMWVIRGGPPDQPVVLFEYDPSRSGNVPVRLLEGFTGTLQADGYAGYAKVCRENDITRIGCWDHARRKYIEAIKGAPSSSKTKKGKVSKADMALSYIRKLYAIEREIQDRKEAERYRVRQEMSVPLLNEFKSWLEKNVSKVMKGSLTRTAMEYTLNQWPYLIGYCEKGYLNISNALAENAIRPFAIGRRAWLFADTSQGARASATCYSLIETAKANQLEPSAYIHYVLNRIGEADTVEKLEALLPWNVVLESSLKNVAQYS
ncbi:IS66 family transposase OrfB [Oleiphilus messinensis]|uniref:IS66 family transposase OrfB n=1 Tax=Oleiphilus messinensis TaxID=141451 RepID=A0A1Y0IH63_9GAMM|nr:IS66 family transposase [Oleiphilus messinensis]ARU59479.1 IS66 family transposase OrfB [Oleiphilus messinensis]